MTTSCAKGVQGGHQITNPVCCVSVLQQRCERCRNSLVASVAAPHNSLLCCTDLLVTAAPPRLCVSQLTVKSSNFQFPRQCWPWWSVWGAGLVGVIMAIIKACTSSVVFLEAQGLRVSSSRHGFFSYLEKACCFTSILETVATSLFPLTSLCVFTALFGYMISKRYPPRSCVIQLPT